MLLVGEVESVSRLESLELRGLDAVECVASDASVDLLLSQTSHEQVDAVRRGVKTLDHGPIGAGDLLGTGTQRLDSLHPALPHPLVLAGQTVVSPRLDVPGPPWFQTCPC